MELEEYRGYTITLSRDEYPESPREWDNMGTMLYVHPRYVLGDRGFHNVTELEQHIRENFGRDPFVLPLYIYDHSGVVMKTTEFHDIWDSGQVGYIVVSREKARYEYGVKRITSRVKALVYGVMRGEVETFSQYISGDVWCHRVDDSEGNPVESCCGFFGYDYALEEAKHVVDWFVDNQ